MAWIGDSPIEDTEPVADFEPDFDLDPKILEGFARELGMDGNGDVGLFRQSQADGLAILVERRKKYGSHIDNHVRFPKEDICGLYLKCTRMVRMIEADYEIDDDTLMDIANYAHLIRSARTKN